MSLYPWKKAFAVSSILAVAGILACFASILNIVIPKGTIAILAAMIPLGAVIMGILIGFVWVCNKYENYFDSKDKPDISEKQKQQSQSSTKTNEKQITNDCCSQNAPPKTMRASPLRYQNLSSFRNFAGPRSSLAAMVKHNRKQWHGQ